METSFGKNGKTDLSVVIPVYNEEKNIESLYKKVTGVFKNKNYELIFVDDGSDDRTFDILRALHDSDFKLNVIRLAANFGKGIAYSAGFDAAKGDLIATMDGDMQDNPEDIPLLVEKLKEGYDMVVGWKQGGKSSKFKFIISTIFNFFIRAITRLNVNDINCPLRVFRREVAKRLNLYGDLYRYIPLLAHGFGYKIAQVKVRNSPRIYGSTKYTHRKYINSFFDFISAYFSVKYSTRPLHFFGKVGLLSFALGFVIDLWLTLRFFAGIAKIDEDLPTLILGVLLIILGTLFFAIGLLGDMQVKNMFMANPEFNYRVETKLIHHK